MKKRWIYASVTALFLGMMTGCAQQTQTETQHAAEKDGDTPAWKTYAKEDPVTLDWYVNYSWFDMGWGKNLVSQKITDETGVSVNFITPLGNEDEKLNALIASDSLPDLITLGWWEPQVNEMIQKNLVYALNDLADQYDMYFYKVADPAVVDCIRMKRGIYMDIRIPPIRPKMWKNGMILLLTRPFSCAKIYTKQSEART